MPYSDLPVDILLIIVGFLDLDVDHGTLNSWLQTSKFHTDLLTPILYDHGLCPIPKQQGDPAVKRYGWIESRLSRRAASAAPHWESERMVKYFLSRLDNRFPCDSARLNVLEYAVQVKAIAVLKTLLSHDEARSKYLKPHEMEESTLLRRAICSGSPSVIGLLRDAGVDIAYINKEGESPLHLAASRDSIEIIELLIAAGADVWATVARDFGRRGWFPVRFPIMDALVEKDDGKSREGFAQPLLKAMLKTEHRAPSKDWKLEVLSAALRYNSHNCGLVQSLVDSGMDVYTPGKRGYTALEMVLECGGSRNIDTGSIVLYEKWAGNNEDLGKVAAIMLRVEAYVWTLGQVNRRLWECAQDMSEIDKCSMVLFRRLGRTKKSALDFVDKNGNTALHYLCGSDDHTRIGELVSWPYYFNNDAYVSTTRLQIMALLLDDGACISTQNNNEVTPPYLAIQAGPSQQSTLLLLRRPKDPAVNIAHTVSKQLFKTPVLKAAALGKPFIVQLLLDHGADVSTIDEDGSSTLHHAVRSESFQVVKLLLKAGCPVSAVHPYDGTALHIAVCGGFNEAIEALLNMGCSLYDRDMQGRSVLWRVARESDIVTLKRFLPRECRNLKELDEATNGFLVCNALNKLAHYYHLKGSRVWGSRYEQRVKEVVDFLVKHGAAFHDGCQTCDMWRNEYSM